MADALSNDNDPHSKHLFLDKFPSEITAAIFSYLGQDDCLTCMSVCRRWYTIVPQCSQSVWKDLHISGSDTRVNDPRWRLCIGEHVQNVKFYTMKEETCLYDVMQKLIDAGCNQVKSFAFYECYTSRIYDFNFLLGQLTKSTAELTFGRHSNGLGLNHLLALCPKLTYLSFKDSLYEYLSLQGVPFAADLQVEFTSLTHLFVDVALKQVTHKLLPILQYCPNLQYLGYKNAYLSMDEDDAFLPNAPTIDLDVLFSLCPKLVYLEVNSEEFLNYRNIQSHSSNDKDTPGLRFFTARETSNNDVAKIEKYLRQHAGTLECLSIHGGFGDWTSTLRRLQLPRLRVLTCSSIMYEDGAMDMFLSHSPILEELSILCIHRANLHVLRTLQYLTRLRRLDLRGVVLYYESNPTAAATPIDQSTNTLALQDVRLADSYPVNDELLQMLTRSYALKSVAIDFPYQAQESVIGDMLCRFIERLNGTKVESLQLSGARCSAAAILAIGNLQFIGRVALFNPYRRGGISIDGAGLLQMLRNRSLRSVDIFGLNLLGDKDDNAVFKQIEAQGFELTKVYDRETGLYNLFVNAK